MHLNIAVLEGDGIGPEVVAQSLKCLRSVEETFGHSFTFAKGLVGATAIEKEGNPLPEKTLKICKESDAILFGAIGSPKYDDDPNSEIWPEQGLLRLRKELDLFANIRPVKVFPALIKQSPLSKKIVKNTDLVIYRELSGGIYYGEKDHDPNSNSATDICTYNEEEISRIAHLAFKAAKNRKQKVTLVDKANVLQTSRLWRRVVYDIAKSYPEVTLEALFVDNAAVQMVLNPSQFDVILTDNMFGDILSDQGSVIAGSIGLLPSASVGTDYAMFEPIHGSYPNAKGKNTANPVAAILSVAMLLQHFKLHEESDAVVAAVLKSFSKNIVTPDIMGSSKYGTDYVGDFIADNIMELDDHFNMNDENIDLGKSTII
ncbi:3-isopropylmalate dehydrogenase [Maribacter sp. MMG018]|uniref:3-isopropylmalate dehydrogenase n=1 Tax=Maribacter sp. MMG018 TaxID=2822688 RepID=UPI001B387D60|nr:3-isopropylmalate dehydrogenase [Maribacter sp. MMG018]MBQ4914952.1 3-isopropylmalate dehydrogenase [Maribacter sp. MMG018]